MGCGFACRGVHHCFVLTFGVLFVSPASIARKIYLRSGTGVGAFRKVYGGRKNKGTRKEKFQKASGGMIRSILINLANMGVIEKLEDGGRKITKKGQKDLDLVATTLTAPASEW